MKKAINWLFLAAAYFRMNLRSHLEYRGAFISQVVSMAINDAGWIVFWTLFFTRFPVLHGWTQKDVMTIWAISAAGFGIAASLGGNLFQLAKLVSQGQLDAWLLYPRAVLPHIALGRMVPSAIGDALFGYFLFIVFIRPDAPHLVLFVLFTLCAAMLFLGFMAMAGSLSFFVGNAEVLAEQWLFSLITFSTYPAPLFQGAVKVILYTLIPAGFISYLPVEALHTLSPVPILSTIAGSLLFLALGTLAFYTGLKRYESGNLVSMQG